KKIETFDVSDLTSRIACLISRGDGSNGTYHPLIGIEGTVAAVAPRNQAGDPAGQIGDIKCLDLLGAALAVEDALPARLDAASEWRHHAEARDDNPPHFQHSSPAFVAHNKTPAD